MGESVYKILLCVAQANQVQLPAADPDSNQSKKKQARLQKELRPTSGNFDEKLIFTFLEEEATKRLASAAGLNTPSQTMLNPDIHNKPTQLADVRLSNNNTAILPSDSRQVPTRPAI